MRWVVMVAVAAIAVACDRPRETVVLMPPEEPQTQPATTIIVQNRTVPAENRQATSEDQRASERAADPAREPPQGATTPLPKTEGPAPSGSPSLSAANSTAPPPKAEQGAVNGYGYVPAGDVTVTEGSTQNPGEPRADLSARVVFDAGLLRYELYASAPKPWLVKNTTPFNLLLRPSSGVTLSQTHFSRNDFVNPNALVKQITADVTATAPGEHVIEAEVELYVCSAELCKRMNERLRTAFTNPGS